MTAARPARIAALDAARGVAVVLMIAWHAADAWLAAAPRVGAPFAVARALGGLAAPFFLLLAGAGLALAAPPRPDAAWLALALRKAARIVVAGEALSIFSWGVDHGAVLVAAHRLPLALATLGIVLLALATGERGHPALRALAALAGIAAGAGALATLHPTAATGRELLLRVDVLHCIGASLIVTVLLLAALGRASERIRIAVLAVLAALIAAFSLASIGAPQRVLPAALAAWIARAEPWSPRVHAGFPLVPWAAYALAGAALARWVGRPQAALAHPWALPRVTRPGLALAFSLGIAALAADDLAPARDLAARMPDVWSLLRLVRNAALISALGAAIAALGPRIDRTLAALALLGRHSLIVYAVHLEIVFGAIGTPLRGALGWATWALAVAALGLAMLALAYGIERHEAHRAPRRASGAATRAASSA